MKRQLLFVAALCVAVIAGTADGVGLLGVSRAGHPLAAPDTIVSPAGPGSAEPNLAVGPDGRVYMSWLEPADSGFALRFSSFDANAWSRARTIRSGRDFFVNWADFPSIEVLGDGRLVAHWLQRTGRATYAYGVRVSQSRDDGQTWSPAITPHRDSSNTEHGFVSLWPEKERFGAVWLDGRNFSKEGHSPRNEMMVVTTTLDGSGKAGAEVPLDQRACDCCQTSAAMTSNGPIIAYRDRSPDEIRDIYVVRRVNEKWTAPVAAHNDGWKIAACPVNGPAIDALGARVALAWFTGANDSPRVKLAFSSNSGAKFGQPIRIDEGTPAGRADVALLPDGGALVSWIERTGGDTAAVLVRRVHRNGKSAAPMIVAQSSASRASGFPRMMISGEHAFFAWTAPGRPSAVKVARLSLANIR
ncbi:MAG: sialidase family protein [Gemmatimonadaceae bacterium]